jgi:hypothetical protein
VKSPGRLISEKTPTRDRRRDISNEGNMIRSVSTDRGKGRGRKAIIPGLVDEHSVKADKRGFRAAVSPSKLAAPKGKLDNPKGVDSGVEKISIRSREIGIIPVCRVPGKVKISCDDPGGIIARVVRSQVLEEELLPLPITRRVDVREAKKSVIAGESQIYGQRVSRGERAHRKKQVGVPGRDKAAGSADGVNAVITVERRGEKGGGFRRGDVLKLGLLKTNERGFRRKEVSTNVNALVRIT